jgi:hypothetical protein
MRNSSAKLASFAFIAILTLCPIFTSALSGSVRKQGDNPIVASLVSADDHLLASFGSFFVHLLGGIRLFGGVSFGSILAGSPAASTPYLTPGSGWTGPTAQPAQQGSSGTTGYNDDAIAVWDAVPFQLLTATTALCVDAYQVSGISHVSFAVDGGTWANIYAQTTGTSGVPEYCAYVNPLAFTDGKHEARAIVYPNAGYPRVLQSSATVTETSGSAILAQVAHGQINGKNITVSGSSDGNIPNGTYYLIKSNLGADQYSISTTTTGSALTAGASGTFTITHTGAGQTEATPHQDESLFFGTNSHGLIPTQVAYVDSINGSDTNNCETTSTPCADLKTALASMVPVNGSANFGQTIGHSDGCTTFSRTGDTSASPAYAVAQGVMYSGTNGTYFVSGTLYWIVSAASNVLTLSATPGGSCIYDPTVSGTPDLFSDVSNDTIYLMCGSGCSSDSPATYTLGGSTLPGYYQPAYWGYLNVVPASGVPVSNVEINAVGNLKGLAAGRLHLTATIATQPITLTTNADSPAGQATLNFASVPAQITNGMSLISGGGCAPFTSGQSGTTLTQITIGSHTGTSITLSSSNAVSPKLFNDCPSGTTFEFDSAIGIDGGTDLWLDGVVYSSPSYEFPNGPTGSEWTGGVYITQSTTTDAQSGAGYAAYVSRTTVDSAQQCFDDVGVLINSMCSGVGTDGIDTNPSGYASTADTPSGSATFTLSSLPPELNIGWAIYASCLTGGGGNVTGYNVASKTVTASVTAASDCPAGTIVTFNDLVHSDFAFQNAQGNDDIVDTSVCATGCDAEALFQQSGPFFDMGYFNNNIHATSINGGFETILLEAPTTNNFFYKNTFQGNAVFRTDLGFSGTDVYFYNNTCFNPTGLITAGASGISGISFFENTGC